MKIQRYLAAIVFTLAILLPGTGCRADSNSLKLQKNSESQQENTQVPTIHILLRNTASGLERVLDTLYAQMNNTDCWRLDFTFVETADYTQHLARSLTAHDNYDLVFDAQWISLLTQVEKNSYKNLKNYFNNPDYPALKAKFTPEYLEANTIKGGVYAIPFTNTYYDVPGIFYRKDFLKTFGLPFNEITSREQMEQFWDTVQKSGIKPLSLGSRGFYEYNRPGISLRQAGIWEIPGWSFWDYPSLVILSQNDRDVMDVVFPGDDAARFISLSSDYKSNILDDYLQRNVVDNRWLVLEDILEENGTYAFLSGQSASFERTLNSGSGQIQQQIRTGFPEAEVAFWPYDIAFERRNRTPGSIPTTYTAWNYLCIPSYNSNTEQTMRFLDWLYSDWSRVDLFNYGVEGVDWKAIGEDEYELLQPVGVEPFTFPAYEMAWNPQHHRVDTSLSDNEKNLMKFIFDLDSYKPSPLSGFLLNTNPIAIELAGLNSLYDEYYTAFNHGAYGDSTQEKIAEFHARSKSIGLETVRGEIHRQIQDYLNRISDTN